MAYRVLLDAHHAYIANNNGVVVFDVHRPVRPHKIGELPLGITFGVCVENGRAYVSSGNRLTVWDVHDPANPREVAGYGGLRGAHDIYVVGSFIYVAEAKKGLIILERSNQPIQRNAFGHR